MLQENLHWSLDVGGWSVEPWSCISMYKVVLLCSMKIYLNQSPRSSAKASETVEDGLQVRLLAEEKENADYLSTGIIMTEASKVLASLGRGTMERLGVAYERNNKELQGSSIKWKLTSKRWKFWHIQCGVATNQNGTTGSLWAVLGLWPEGKLQ